jgi:hypothetical protein
MSKQLSPGQLDAVARQRGFPNYQTWAAWNAHRSAGLQGPQPAAPQQGNFLQNILGKIPIHPAYLLDYVNKKINGAGQ